MSEILQWIQVIGSSGVGIAAIIWSIRRARNGGTVYQKVTKNQDDIKEIKKDVKHIKNSMIKIQRKVK